MNKYVFNVTLREEKKGISAAIYKGEARNAFSDRFATSYRPIALNIYPNETVENAKELVIKSHNLPRKDVRFEVE